MSVPATCSSTPLWEASGKLIHIVSISSLQICSRSACSECTQFLRFFETILGPEIPSDLVFQKQKKQPDTNTLVWDVMADGYEPHNNAIEVHLPTSPLAKTSRKQGYIGWTGSETALKLAHSWIETCIREHSSCERYQSSPLPDRVLDVSENRVRLYETRNEKAPYIALSHCWGTTKANCTTLKHNLVAQQNEIPWDTMPRTFQEAIQITRALGIRYIWIDNVCIVQDDYDDWKCQAVQMASIYKRGYVTIAATASDSDEGGCFRTASNDMAGTIIKIGKTTGSAFEIRLRAQVQAHWMALPGEMMLETDFGDLGDEPPVLFTRAWCYQEKVLSPRYLRFDEWELSWSCKHTEICSCGYLDKISGPARRGRQEKSHQGGKIIDPGVPWREAVEAYCTLALTYEKDRLPAIAALAEEHGTTIRKGDQYVAGLWLSSLIIDMLWVGFANLRGPREIYNTPSWSWVGVSGAGYYFAKVKSLATVVEVNCEPVKELPFAQFRNEGYVVLSSQIVHGRLTKGNRPRSLTFELCDSQVSLDEWKGAYSHHTWLTVDVPDSEMMGAEVTMLLMARYDDELPSSPRGGDYWLILQTVEVSDGTYKRVGLTFLEEAPTRPRNDLIGKAVHFPERSIQIV